MTTYKLRNLWAKMRSWPILRPLYALQRRLGLYARPYYVVREGRGIKKSPPINPELGSFEMRSFDDRDMHLMAGIPDPHISEEALIKRLKQGKRCFGIKCREQIAAFTWVDFEEFGVSASRSLLNENEAYLFDAYTLPSFRGKGLAPLIRYYAYGQLEDMGIKALYSITDFFNIPSIRFKEKLGAKVVELRLLFLARNKRIFDIRLKKY